MLQAKDIMTRGVITVSPDTSVGGVTKTLVENRISAVPVVDDRGRVVGILSEGDLMRRAEIGTERGRSWWLDALAESAELAHEFIRSHGVLASEIMTENVVSIDADTSIAEIASVLEDNNIKRVPVIRRGRLVGIVSRANILQALAAQKEKIVELPLKDDQAIRDRILETLEGESWANLSLVNVVVSAGTVHIWGMVDSEDQRTALRVAAEAVPGVKAVVDHTAIRDARFGAE